MEIENAFTLRPSFSKNVFRSVLEILANATKVEIEVQEFYAIKMSDDHILFFITTTKRKYYPPHLHIKLTENDDKTTNKSCTAQTKPFGNFLCFCISQFREYS